MALVFGPISVGDGGGIDEQMGGVDVDQHRHRADPADRLCCGDESVRRKDHFVSRANSYRSKREFECVGAVGDTDAVVDPGRVRIGLLELGDRLAADERRRGEDLVETGSHLLGDLLLLGDQIDQWDPHRTSCLSMSEIGRRPTLNVVDSRQREPLIATVMGLAGTPTQVCPAGRSCSRTPNPCPESSPARPADSGEPRNSSPDRLPSSM